VSSAITTTLGQTTTILVMHIFINMNSTAGKNDTY